jgi:hypothetical protein
MANIYLLPCSCGKNISVQPRMSGENVACDCGQRVEVPPLRELTRLPPAPNQIAVRPASWDFRKGVVLFGLLLALVAGGFGLYWHSQVRHWQNAVKPDAPSQAFVSRQIDNLTWKDLRKGLYLIPNPEMMIAAREEDFAGLMQWASGGLAVVGLLVAGLSSLLLSPGTRKAVQLRD